MGIANLIGDGISMALGDYISTRSEAEYTINERNREAWEVENNPEGEKREMIDIYKVIHAIKF
jgi:VIT1/CCC1 family predicted Fe2+/Mn2+ transporter